jgi:hypothetical protein
VVSELFQPLVIASLAGLVGGVGLLLRGMGGYRIAGRISDTAGSTISSVAVGEARITGVVEPAELLLVSPLQSATCVYYRAQVDEREDRSERRVLQDERAVGFRLRDPSGSIRVFPRGARWAVPDRFDDHTGMMGEQPAGLHVRLGPAIQAGTMDRDLAIAQLLTVRDPRDADPGLAPLLSSGRHRSYREARIEPGETVTLVGFVAPFDQLPDPTGADDAAFGGLDEASALADPAIAADLAEARERGTLHASSEEAWGNAAIPGFGIGRPIRAPDLDAGATVLPLADAESAQRIERTFAISPEALVVSAAPDVPLLVTFGAPAEAAAREGGRFVLGLLGAVVAIASATLLGVLVAGGLPL